ncbi:hypothetical protein IQ06DRAFT_60645 [Phaeosphaeriaceae sp. SRC1lsM3a]|nr:hypothetical protein IQ06DRAFT_60645 [Stagonospora sp. SRC1lsM3a]
MHEACALRYLDWDLIVEVTVPLRLSRPRLLCQATVPQSGSIHRGREAYRALCIGTRIITTTCWQFHCTQYRSASSIATPVIVRLSRCQSVLSTSYTRFDSSLFCDWPCLLATFLAVTNPAADRCSQLVLIALVLESGFCSTRSIDFLSTKRLV